MAEMSGPIPTSAKSAKGGRTHFGVFLLIAFLFALFVSWSSNDISYEERLIQISVRHLLTSEEYQIVERSPELQALFIDYANDHELISKARLAIEKYGDAARDVLTKYGETAEFQAVLRKYGETTVPVIAFFVANDLTSIRLQYLAQVKGAATVKAAKAAWARLMDRELAAGDVSTAVYGPESRGWYATLQVLDSGHQFLGQFEIDGKGHAHWIQTERFLEGSQWLFTSGFHELERKVALGEDVQIADAAWAGIDLLGVVSAAKGFKFFKGAAAGARTAQKLNGLQKTKFLARPLLQRTLLGRKFMSWGVRAASAYLIIRYPALLNSVFDFTAGILGIPPWLGKILGWTLLGVVLLYPFVWSVRGLLVVAVPALKGVAQGLQWLQIRLFGPRPSPAR